MVEILSQNCNGLNDRTKRRGMFSNLKAKGEVICLQETHATDNVQQFWQQQWGGPAYWSHGASNEKGVAILFSKNLPFDVLNHFSDTQG